MMSCKRCWCLFEICLSWNKILITYCVKDLHSINVGLKSCWQYHYWVRFSCFRRMSFLFILHFAGCHLPIWLVNHLGRRHSFLFKRRAEAHTKAVQCKRQMDLFARLTGSNVIILLHAVSTIMKETHSRRGWWTVRWSWFGILSGYFGSNY